MSILIVSDIVQENGKTIKQNNLERKHNIPIDSLVEINHDFDGDVSEDCRMGGVRMFVVNHSRDCDGTPLYDLSFNKTAHRDWATLNDAKCKDKLSLLVEWQANGQILRHLSEESLTVIRLPD